MYVHVNLTSLRYVSKPPTYTGQTDVDAAVAAAQKGLATLAAMTPMEKSSLLHKLADQIELHADALAHIETLNLGMPIGDAKGNALAGVSTLRYSVPLLSPAPPHPPPPPAAAPSSFLSFSSSSRLRRRLRLFPSFLLLHYANVRFS